MQRVGVFGWGIVAPRSPNIEAFYKNLESFSSWLSPFNGFGPDNFMVGMPDFCFSDYSAWIDNRFPPKRFPQMVKKMDFPTLYAIGAFIQSLSQNPGIEHELQSLGTQAHVYIGTGVGNLATIHQATLDLQKAQNTWNAFWGDSTRNSALQAYLSLQPEEQKSVKGIPPNPGDIPRSERDEAEKTRLELWTNNSVELQEYLRELAEIESLGIEGKIEANKLNVIREKQRRKARLKAKWGAPDPPWEKVSANLIWNISNTPATQVSMLGKITGFSFAPVAACSTFGVTLKLAIDTIRRGEAKAVVIGATDPPPQPILVAAFYKARILAANGQVSKPLTSLLGTHVSGGSVVWIVGDHEYMTAKGYRPLGLEPLAVGVSSDADHIITPSKEGPATAIRQALELAKVKPGEVEAWDLHATATPGDFPEIETLREIMRDTILVTARKGTFGHGMSAGGGWELTAQYLGYEKGTVFPTPLKEDELNREIAGIHNNFIYDTACKTPQGIAGKLSMGIGGINACVISRPWT